MRFEDLSWFGGDKPRAIVAKVRADPTLVELQAEQERRLSRIGIAPETRKFTPHVTLARLRSVKPHAVADYLASRGALAVEAFIAERFVLYSAPAPAVRMSCGPYWLTLKRPGIRSSLKSLNPRRKSRN